MNIPQYIRRPGAGVDAITFTDPESGRRIVEWVEGARGRGAAWISDDGLTLMVPAEEFDGRVVWVPSGWVVYREFPSDRFHIAPQETFDYLYEARP